MSPGRPSPPRPAVSVVIPAFDSEAFVGAAIEGVLAQSVTAWELIVVDDGSTDGTLRVAGAFADDPRVRVLHQENGGPALARNRAIEAARSPLIALLDADDVWVEDHLERMTAQMQTAPDAVLAFGSWQYMGGDGARLPQIVVPFDADPERARRELPWRNALIPSATVVRTEPLRRVGGFDARFRVCADWDLWLRLLAEGRFLASRPVSTLYRTHAAGMTESLDEAERERMLLNEKFHGATNGKPSSWPPQRRRAVGYSLFTDGLARLRQHDLPGGTARIEKAFRVWPEIVDLDECWFELACAFQPRGLRGTGQSLDLPRAAALLRTLDPLPGGRESRGRAAFAMAWMALAADDRRSARRYARTAFRGAGLRRTCSALTILLRSALPRSLSLRLSAWRHGRTIGSQRATS